MIKQKLEKYFSEEVPAAHYEQVKNSLFVRIENYEKRRKAEEFYFVPRVGFNVILTLSLLINVYAFIKQTIEGLFYFHPAVTEAGFSTLSFLSRFFFLTIDNLLLIALNITLIALIPSRRLINHDTFEKIKNLMLSFNKSITSFFAFFLRSSFRFTIGRFMREP